jgi:predicted RNase H-like nuclease (RuvC/YqgF family)
MATTDKLVEQLKRKLEKQNTVIELLKRKDEARFLEWQVQKNKAEEAEQKANSLQKEVERLNDELESKDTAYERLVRIAQALSTSLSGAAHALKTISGGF